MFTIINALFILRVILVAVAEDSQECGYFDTVDLRDSRRLDDGSYLYKDILIPSEKVQEYSYRITVFNSNKTVDPYLRGCLCHIKSCVLLCCEPTKLMENKISLNMTLINGTESQVNVRNEFVVQVKYEIPCDVLGDPNYNEQTQPDWKLFQDGTLHNLTSNTALEKQDYCLLPHKLDENYYLLPQIIKKDSETVIELDFISAIRVISVFCIVIIIAVYLYLPHLRSRAYSQCCLYYFICIVISFILLWVESLTRSNKQRLACYFMACCGYYIVMSAFLWLLVINYNVWKLLTKYQQETKMKRYHIFVWGTAGILLTITVCADCLSQGMEDIWWQPGIAVYYCWINTNDWSALIYYFGPILLIIVINLTLSTVTVRHIYVETRKNAKEWNNSESKTTLRNKSDFVMFLRMFVIAGVVWGLEVVSYLFDLNSELVIRIVFDIVTTGQGLILFFVTIWKKDIIKALYKRLESKTSHTKSKSNISENNATSTST